jgi:hypothetical protein
MADEKKIKESISRWNEVRNTIDGYNLLRSGSGIELKYEELQQLIKGDGNNIHIYLGCTPIKETEMKITETRITEMKETETKITETKITETKGGKRDMLFYFVDSANDKNDKKDNYVLGTTIFEKKFVEPEIGEKLNSTTTVEVDTSKRHPTRDKVDINIFKTKFNKFVEDLMNFVQSKKEKNSVGLILDFTEIIDFINIKEPDSKIADEYLGSYLGSVLPTFRWLFYGNTWFKELQKDGNIVQVFSIGKNDFIDVLNALNGEGSAFLYFALKENKKNIEKKYKKEIDIYIAACQPENMNIDNDYASMIKHISADVATPCPPYCEVEDDDKDKDFPLLP